MIAVRLFAIAGSLAAAGLVHAQATIGFATLPPGSLLHAQASVMAKVIQDNTKHQIRVIGFGGDAAALEAIGSDKAEFMALDIGETVDAHLGQRTWVGKAKTNLRLVAQIYPFQVGWFVRKDSPFQVVADLKGKRMPSGWVAHVGNIPHTEAMLAAGGISYKDVVNVPAVNVVRAADDFKSGKLDAFTFAVGAPKVAEVAAGVGGLRLLPIDDTPEVAAKIKAVRPVYYVNTAMPAPHVAGVEAPTKVMAFDYVLFASNKVSDDIVYDVTKALHANKKTLVEGHPSFGAFDPAQAAKPQQSLAHHPGAIKFYKEAGLIK